MTLSSARLSLSSERGEKRDTYTRVSVSLSLSLFDNFEFSRRVINRPWRGARASVVTSGDDAGTAVDRVCVCVC